MATRAHSGRAGISRGGVALIGLAVAALLAACGASEAGTTAAADGDVATPAPAVAASADQAREDLVAADAARAEVIVVTAVPGGYEPAEVVVTVGEPVIIQFVNRTDRERHFHVMGLAPDRIDWLAPYGMTRTAHGDTVPIRHEGDIPAPELLRAAEWLPLHICVSDTGICQLAENVHFHAGAGYSDAVMFTPERTGSFGIVDPGDNGRHAILRVVQ